MPIAHAHHADRRLILLSALAVAACGRAKQVAAPRQDAPLRMAILPPDNGGVGTAAWTPIVADMQAATGFRATVVELASEADFLEALRRKRIDFGWIGAAAALLAVRRADGEVFARPQFANDSPGDHEVLATGSARAIALAKAMKCDRRLSIGLGDAQTVSALAVETYLLAPAGQTPETCFRTVHRAPDGANLNLLATGRLDLAAVDSKSLGQGDGRSPGVREIWRSPDLPAPPLVWRRDLDPAIKEKIRQFFLTYGQDGGVQQRRLAALGLAGFVPADGSHLLPIREMDAAHGWWAARLSGDKARIAKARRSLDAITAERLALEARTGAPAAQQ